MVRCFAAAESLNQGHHSINVYNMTPGLSVCCTTEQSSTNITVQAFVGSTADAIAFSNAFTPGMLAPWCTYAPGPDAASTARSQDLLCIRVLTDTREGSTHPLTMDAFTCTHVASRDRQHDGSHHGLRLWGQH
jgi:hypothetical protein